MNVEMIREDVKFPISYDGITYLWDAEGNMIAQFMGDVRRLENEVVQKLNDFAANDFHADNTGYQFTKHKSGLIAKDGEEFMAIRGWGHFQYKDNAEKRFDNVVDLFLQALNAA